MYRHQKTVTDFDDVLPVENGEHEIKMPYAPRTLADSEMGPLENMY